MKKIGIVLMLFINSILLAPEPVVPIPIIPKVSRVKPVNSKSVVPRPVVLKPVVSKAVTQVASRPVVPKSMVLRPVVSRPVVHEPVEKVAVKANALVAKTVELEKPMASQVVGVIVVKNTSKYKLSWTGWKTKYKTQDGKIHYKLHKLKVPHHLPYAVKNKVTKTLHGYTVHNLPANSFVEGVSHLMINAQPVSVEYQGSAWMPGTTDAIYITSTNGAIATLDKKAMDKSYKEINLGISKSKKAQKPDDDAISKVTDVTKAASVPMVLTDKKNQKKFKNIKKAEKISKSSKAFDHTAAARVA